MAILQSTYSDDHRAAVAGMIANPATCDIDSRVVKGTTPIPFGVGVQQGTAYNEVIAGVAAHKFVGISVLDSTLQPIQEDEYVAGDVMSVMYRGDIWVEVENPVLVGDNVKADPVSGKLSSTEDQVLERITCYRRRSELRSRDHVHYVFRWWRFRCSRGGRDRWGRYYRH